MLSFQLRKELHINQLLLGIGQNLRALKGIMCMQAEKKTRGVLQEKAFLNLRAIPFNFCSYLVYFNFY
jgi:hypothetical protein